MDDGDQIRRLREAGERWSDPVALRAAAGELRADELSGGLRLLCGRMSARGSRRPDVARAVGVCIAAGYAVGRAEVGPPTAGSADALTEATRLARALARYDLGRLNDAAGRAAAAIRESLVAKAPRSRRKGLANAFAIGLGLALAETEPSRPAGAGVV